MPGFRRNAALAPRCRDCRSSCRSRRDGRLVLLDGGRTVAFVSCPNCGSTVSGWLPARRRPGIERAAGGQREEPVLPRAREVLQERAAHRADRVHLVEIDAAEDVPAEGADVARLDRHVPQDLAGDAGADLMDVRLLDVLVHAADALVALSELVGERARRFELGDVMVGTGAERGIQVRPRTAVERPALPPSTSRP